MFFFLIFIFAYSEVEFGTSNTMTCRIFNRNFVRKLAVSHKFNGNCRWLSHYPIDETIFGLTDDQITVGTPTFPLDF